MISKYHNSELLLTNIVHCFVGVMSSLPRNEIIMSIVFRVEKMLDLMRSETKRQGKIVNQVVQVLNMEGFGRKHIWMPGKL